MSIKDRLENVLSGSWGAGHAAGDVWTLGDDLVPDWETPGGGGGSTPVTREQIVGNPVSIANGATAPLPWNIVSSGDPLLDLTTPTAPSVVDAGVYAVAAQINAEDAMSLDGVFSASLALDNSGDFAGMSGVSNAAYAGFEKPYLALSLTYYIPAGGTIVVTVGNFDGANAIQFDLFGIVQRLS